MNLKTQIFLYKNKNCTQTSFFYYFYSFITELSSPMNEIFKWKKKYFAELKAFALTLNFYLSTAYKYVRRKRIFKKFLPDSSTIYICDTKRPTKIYKKNCKILSLFSLIENFNFLQFSHSPAENVLLNRLKKI